MKSKFDKVFLESYVQAFDRNVIFDKIILESAKHNSFDEALLNEAIMDWVKILKKKIKNMWIDEKITTKTTIKKWINENWSKIKTLAKSNHYSEMVDLFLQDNPDLKKSKLITDTIKTTVYIKKLETRVAMTSEDEKYLKAIGKEIDNAEKSTTSTKGTTID